MYRAKADCLENNSRLFPCKNNFKSLTIIRKQIFTLPINMAMYI